MDSTLPGFATEDCKDGGPNMAQEPGAAEAELLLFKTSPIHGTGGFAKTAICKGTRILEYLGEKITKGESLRRCEQNNAYIFTLNDQQDLDGNVPWNPA